MIQLIFISCWYTMKWVKVLLNILRIIISCGVSVWSSHNLSIQLSWMYLYWDMLRPYLSVAIIIWKIGFIFCTYFIGRTKLSDFSLKVFFLNLYIFAAKHNYNTLCVFIIAKLNIKLSVFINNAWKCLFINIALVDVSYESQFFYMHCKIKYISEIGS